MISYPKKPWRGRSQRAAISTTLLSWGQYLIRINIFSQIHLWNPFHQERSCRLSIGNLISRLLPLFSWSKARVRKLSIPPAQREILRTTNLLKSLCLLSIKLRLKLWLKERLILGLVMKAVKPLSHLLISHSWTRSQVRQAVHSPGCLRALMQGVTDKVKLI